MKATGIVRRVDDLGRIVIPRELRKLACICEGDRMEIIVNDDDSITLKNCDETLPAKDLLRRVRDFISDDWSLKLETRNQVVEILEKAIKLIDND